MTQRTNKTDAATLPAATLRWLRCLCATDGGKRFSEMSDTDLGLMLECERLGLVNVGGKVWASIAGYATVRAAGF